MTVDANNNMTTHKSDASTITSESATPSNTKQQAQAPKEITDSSVPSCKKCVKVLRELIAGLQEEKSSARNESHPLTLLRAIARDTTTATTTSRTNTNTASTTSSTQQQLLQSQIRIEPIDDGVKMHLPVETTLPNVLRRWSTWQAATATPTTLQDLDDGTGENRPRVGGVPLAISAVAALEDTPGSNAATAAAEDAAATDATTNPPRSFLDPLTIELKCRKCASEGPEGGARAFLMGPQPLSVVVCHNRIHGTRDEVEEILTHELVHLHDVQTLQLDLQQCENLAYSEVRAAKAAECRDSWNNQLQAYCVKQKAICATNNLFPREGRNCIQKVFHKAFADNRPFDEEERQ